MDHRNEVKKGILALAKMCVNVISQECESAETSFGKIKTVTEITEETLAHLYKLAEEEPKMEERIEHV